jgi:molybdenum cofactor synthesis domain-containing protein
MENPTPLPAVAERSMISPDEALQLVLDATTQLPVERRSLLDSAGLTLAEPVVADRDQPPFNRAMMDGYAVPEGAAGQRLAVVEQVAAGHAAGARLTQRHCVEIMTGAPCPDGTVAVVPREQVKLDGNSVLLPTQIKPGQYIALRGSEHQVGKPVLREGDRIDALAVAVLASVGKASIRVVRPPMVTVVTTGAELVPPGSTPGPSQIRDSNGPMLHAMARGVGIERPALEHATDQFDSIVEKLRQFAEADVLILTGGVSAGRFDLVPDAVRHEGGEFVFHKVRQKPGKPMLLARRGKQLIFGLPGNPLACHLCFHRYVGPAIRKMQGGDPNRRTLLGRLAEAVKPRSRRTQFVLGIAQHPVDARADPLVHPMSGKSSADLFRAVAPNCYLEIPSGGAPIPAGESVRFTRIDEI